MAKRNKASRGKIILVAGGAGFVGSHLCTALLGAGNRVICLDSYLTGSPANLIGLQANPYFAMVEQDVCDEIDIDEPVDQIYNLACPASPPSYQADPIHTMMTSVTGTGNLLRLAERHGATFLQASTSEIYGDPEEHPQQENYWGHVNCTGPRACYDEGKRAAEALCFDSLRAGSVDTRVARIFNTYGPHMRPNDGRIVSNFIVQALKNEPLTVYGSGEQTRSFCYVSDLVDGLIRLMNRKENPAVPVNLGNPGEFTVIELAELVLSRIETASTIVHEPLPADDPQRRRPDIARARKLLGWEPKVPLEDGLTHTIAWFQSALGGSRAERRSGRTRRQPQLSVVSQDL
ncbi:SDR family oxidoreductase [Sinorhizobium meliloti]|jgi:UDP-glucuronate decarboxylase|uniref:UDP-xylose synthase 2 n=1 Tax=Rhizobium meliloti (strain 1021) TaxID=266834 RepID=Q92WV0_RHIME|nr:UDP-glucuronic acid decarboxylase family protein [Sinorhizobium meliloti]ACY30252.1 UDP-xylose synthase 2 [Sinorhizobium meliloti 1021]AEG55634.1 UDP-glucuronate decarboxylase [Sinorhizobium meliloti AK83]AGA11461.1 Nucleoside-diphosphate-sugar epimerase [Sinorhizobium meliloti GR4]AGG71229.1 Putative dTDP-glucose 4,6-dehydratase [Sinorhizobium meliloti 2011]ASJ62637.1 dTDP-glucose 4,6-dehydratase [Sinorhizobium meliloti]